MPGFCDLILMLRLWCQDSLDTLAPERPGEKDDILEEEDTLVGHPVARVGQGGEGDEAVRHEGKHVKPTYDLAD